MGPNVLLQVRLQSRNEGMKSLLIYHSRKPILQLLELLDVACDSAGLPQCSELLARFFNFSDRLKPLHYCISKLSPCAKDWPVAFGYFLKNRIHPGARCTLYPHGHNIEPISRGVVHQSHVSLHLGELDSRPWLPFAGVLRWGLQLHLTNPVVWGAKPPEVVAGIPVDLPTSDTDSSAGAE